MSVNYILKIVFTFLVLELARSENESSDLTHQNLVSLIPDLSEITLSINDARMITCSGYDLRWKNPWGNYIDNKHGRVHVEDMSTTKDEVHELRLVFVKIDAKDFGNYTCEGKNGNKSFELIIYDPVEFAVQENDVTVNELESVILPCTAKGNPIPVIFWSFEGQSIFEDSIRYKKHRDGLWISNVQRNDTGYYVCKALQSTASEIKDQKEKMIHLNVQYRPEISYNKRMKKAYGNIDNKSGKRIKYSFINETLELICEAFGNPMPDFMWYHNGKKISHHNVQNKNGSSTLKIHVHHIESFGGYKCVAKNFLGHADFKVYIEEGYQPHPPEKFELKGYGHESFDINLGSKIEVSEDSLMTIKQYRFEMMRKDDFEENGSVWRRPNIRDMLARPNVSYLITDLQPNTTYIMRVASINIAGLSPWSEFKEFTTLSHAPQKGFAARNLFNQFLFFTTILLIVNN